MAIQLPFPARWALLESRRGDARGRLDSLRHDVLTTKAAIRSALDELALDPHRPALATLEARKGAQKFALTLSNVCFASS